MKFISHKADSVTGEDMVSGIPKLSAPEKMKFHEIKKEASNSLNIVASNLTIAFYAAMGESIREEKNKESIADEILDTYCSFLVCLTDL